MSLAKADKRISPISIIAQIVDGSIKIDSIEEFRSILEIFPEDPELQRKYSDLLAQKNETDTAAESYGKAADLFIDSGRMLQAIAAKSLGWKIAPPSDLTETHQFFSMLHKDRFAKTPLTSFFSKLSFPELFAIISNLKTLELSPGSMFKKNADGENALFMVVSGNLAETMYLPVKIDKMTLYEKNLLNLRENDYFGDFYPFDEKNLSHSYIEAVSQVELVKISKSLLKEICKKYQDVELAVHDLKKDQSKIGKNYDKKLDRKGVRHYLPAKVSLSIIEKADGNNPLLIDGYSLDLSIGGICILLDSVGRNSDLFSKAIHNARVKISLPSESMSLTVSGTVVWSKVMRIEKEKTFALGIRFEDMTPKLKGMVFAFADNICRRNDFASFSPLKLF